MLRFVVFHLFWTATSVSAATAAHIIHDRTTPRRPLQVQQQQQQRQAQENSYTSNADGKHFPVVATPNCTEFATRDYLNRNDIPLPCRQRDEDDSDAAVNTPPQFAPPPAQGADTLPEGDLGSESTTGNNEAASNGNRVRITLFVGIRPFLPNIEPIVTAVVTKWLNSTERVQNMEFFLYDPFVTRQRRRRTLRLPRRVQDDELLGVEGGEGDAVDDTLLGIEGGSESGGTGGFLDNTIYQQQEGGQPFPTSASTHASIFTLIHFDTESDLVVKTSRRWYWKHTVVYDCLYREDRSPVLDFSLLQYVTENVTQALDDSGEAASSNEDSKSNHGLTMTLRQRTGDEGVTITIKPEELPATAAGTEAIGTREPASDEKGSTNADPSFPATDDMFATNNAPHDGHYGDAAGESHHSGVTYTTPLDSQYWDWRRYLGLSLFLGTIVGTFVLSQIHAYRQRRLIKSQVWGNLASEEGVNELLKTGWKVQGTSPNKKVMEVYDKSKWGYRENDSMLIGGFEQREAVVGAEITLTHAPSETNTQANHSITQDSHHTPPPQPPYPVATTPTGSVVNAASVNHQYGSPPSTPPRGGGGGDGGSPSTTRKTNNKGSPPLSRSRF